MHGRTLWLPKQANYRWTNLDLNQRASRTHLLDTALSDIRFSNLPVYVKRFQTIHGCSVDVARGVPPLGDLMTLRGADGSRILVRGVQHDHCP
jgi:hypothetical protein